MQWPGPNAAERLAILTAVLGAIGWIFTKVLPSLFSRHRANKTAKLIRVARLERDNNRLKRALLVLISAVEMGVSIDKMTPHVRRARQLLEEEEQEEQKLPRIDPPDDVLL